MLVVDIVQENRLMLHTREEMLQPRDRESTGDDEAAAAEGGT